LIILIRSVAIGLPVPFGISLLFLVLYTLQLLFFLRTLRVHSDLLVCPVLPGSLPDDLEWYDILKEVRGIRNYQLSLRMNLLWNPYRSEQAFFSYTGEIHASGTFPRGIYQVSNYHLRVSDWAGFFIYHVPGRVLSSLTVYPGDHRRVIDVNLFHQSFSDHNAPVPLLRNQEEFEARPYHPGDDPRRIHWKMLARHEELFIREGSGVNRDKKSILLIFDPGQVVYAKGLRKQKAFRMIDSVIRSLSAVLESLEEEGFSVLGIFPGPDRFIDLSSLSRTDRRTLLASVPPVPLKRLPEPSGRSFGSILFFAASEPGRGLLDTIDHNYGTASKSLFLSSDHTSDYSRRGWSVVQA